MNRKHLVVTAAIVSLVGFGAATQLTAASNTNNLTISTSVAANCVVSTGSVAFAAYDPVGANATADLDGAGTFTVSCTKGASGITLALGTGSNGARKMKLASGTDLLSYELYSDSARTTVFNSTSMANPTTKAAVTVNVYGRIAKNQDVGIGSYADTVVATVNF
jgi:spore coat protein U-like protein